MNSATMHNAPNTAQTSRRKLPSEVELSEADYLAREVADAKCALSSSVADLKAGLQSSADLRLWVKHYPWAALGAATVAGFAAGAAVTPAKGESVKEKLSRLAASAKASESSGATDQATSHVDAARSTQSTFLTSLFDIAKVLIESMIIATLRAPKEESPQNVAPTDRRQATTAST